MFHLYRNCETSGSVSHRLLCIASPFRRRLALYAFKYQQIQSRVSFSRILFGVTVFASSGFWTPLALQRKQNGAMHNITCCYCVWVKLSASLFRLNVHIYVTGPRLRSFMSLKLWV